MSIEEASKAMGYSGPELRRALMRRGYTIEPRPGGRESAPSNWAQIADCYCSGMRFSEIDRQMGLKHGYALYAVRRMAGQRGARRYSSGAPVIVERVRAAYAMRHPQKDSVNARIVEMYCRQGKSAHKVGKALGIAGSTVTRRLESMGIQRRTHGKRQPLRKYPWRDERIARMCEIAYRISKRKARLCA